MVALKSERRVYMWHLTPRPSPKQTPKSVGLAEIVGILKSAYSAETAEMYLAEEGRILDDDAPASQRDPKNRIYIADFSEDTNNVTLLINRGDPHVADTAFIHAKSRTVRTIAPGQDESQGWSAHLVIAKQRVGGRHRACFERAPHITSSYVGLLLRRIIDRAVEEDPAYTYEERKRRGEKIERETKRYKPFLSVRKVASEQLKRDLERGELSQIVLINTHAQYAGPDAPGVVKSAKKTLAITPTSADRSRLLKFIDALPPWAKSEGYDQIQVKITGLPGGASSSPRFDLEKEDAAETLYVRSQRLTGFSIVLESCYAVICKSIRQKMVALLNDNPKW